MNRVNGQGGVFRGNGALRTLLIDARGVLVSTLRQRFKNELCNVEEGKRPKWLAPPIYPAQALDVAALLIDTALAVLDAQEHPHDAVMTGCAALNLKSLGALPSHCGRNRDISSLWTQTPLSPRSARAKSCSGRGIAAERDCAVPRGSCGRQRAAPRHGPGPRRRGERHPFSICAGS